MQPKQVRAVGREDAFETSRNSYSRPVVGSANVPVSSYLVTLVLL